MCVGGVCVGGVCVCVGGVREKKKKKGQTVTKHRPQTNKPARMRNRGRETRTKWDDRSTLFPHGLRLKAPVRSQHHDVCRAHACRETAGMTTDHKTRSPDTNRKKKERTEKRKNEKNRKKFSKNNKKKKEKNTTEKRQTEKHKKYSEK